MFKYFKDLNSIRFPVYSIPSDDWYRQDGVLFIDDGKVLDDSNMPGETLGIRRIQCGRTDLCKLKRAYLDFNLMLRSKKTLFIDSNGVPFKYVKSINSKLVHHAIYRIEQKDDHSILRLVGIPFPFTLPRPPRNEARYARVLYYKGMPWTVYDFVVERGKDSFRRV